MVPFTLSRPAGVPITARWHTVDGTATASDADYTAVSDSVIFAPGDTLKFATVSVLGDSKAERGETLRVVIASASGAVVADTSATITIVNDDLPVMAVTNASMPEGDSGATATLVIVSLSGPVSHDVSVEYETRDSTATADDEDYVAATGVLTFPPGVVADTIAVTMNGDETFEPDEVFWVVLSNSVGAIVADSVGSVTIANDDDEPTAVDDMPSIREFALLPPWPNPSNGDMVYFGFELPRQERVQLILYDVAGREVARVADRSYPMGRHQITWDCRRGGRSIATGHYFLRFTSGGKNVVRRVVLIR
jgi:chitinase